MKIISHARFDEGTNYTKSFYYNQKRTGSFYSFPCDKDGNVFPRKNEASESNYQMCLSGKDSRTGETILPGIVESRDYCNRIPSIGQCVCGAKVYLANFTNTCDCGREYNSAGQELAPREQWGEETGEHYSECLGGEGIDW